MVATTYVGNITERAMLVKLNISMFTQSKDDRQASIEVANNHNSDYRMGNYKKKLLPEAALKTHIALSQKIRGIHKSLTLPWGDDGTRILSTTLFDKYVEQMREIEKEWDKATQVFEKNYPSYIEDARNRLNGLFKEGDYPEPSAVRSKFGIRIGFLPLPQACDFRVKMDQSQLDLLKQDVENQINEKLAEANKDTFLRFKGLLDHMLERLKSYKPGAPGVRATNTFKNSMIDNIKDLVNLVPDLNIADSQDLTDLTDRVRLEICSLDCDNLRESEDVRTEAISKTEDILAKMAMFYS